MSAGLGAADLLPAVSNEAAQAFARTWYGGRDGWVVLTRIPADRSVSGGPVSKAVEAERFPDLLGMLDLDGVVADEKANWNTYISCSTHTEDPTGPHGRSRGRKRTVSGVHGVWLDLDVKDGGFSSSADADALVRAMGLRPTIVVNSGSGGRHAYWRLREALSVEKGEKLCSAWVARAREISGVHVDRLATCDRILRLPGTVRWPKDLEGARAVELMWNDPGLVTGAEEVWRWAGSAWERAEAERRAVGERTAGLRTLGGEELARLLGEEGWGGLVGMAGFEDSFNEMMTWDEILLPWGWELLGEDGGGRRMWARPGQEGRWAPAKSAHTDYPGGEDGGSPHVMNLFSDDPRTGLSDLALAHGGRLTKMQVHARLAFGDDVARMVTAVMGSGVNA